MKILLAEDDASLRHVLKTLLQRNHYTVDAVEDGQTAFDYLCLESYDAAILDIMMPHMDGFEIVCRVRRTGSAVPILLLTARSDVEDKVRGLDLGANDYLSKPFDTRELLARLRAITRDTAAETSAISFGNVTLDTKTFVLSAPQGTVTLMNKEYQSMLLFMKNPGWVLPTSLFLEKIWDLDSPAQDNTIWTVIYNLRSKLRTIGADIEIRNRRNQGYVLEMMQ